jgi:hypothetical protein
MDTDIQAVIKDLNLGDAAIDPTTLSGEELVKEVQRIVKALMGYGARMPKELMLYVKNMVFLDGAIARLAPELDILAEIASISMLFAERHGERLGADQPDHHSADQSGARGRGDGIDIAQRRARLGHDLGQHRGKPLGMGARGDFRHDPAIGRVFCLLAGDCLSHDCPVAAHQRDGGLVAARFDPENQRRFQGVR